VISSRVRTAALTVAALLGFAANSLLCRMALGPRLVDAATFTAIRIVSGALMLLLLVRVAGTTREGAPVMGAGSWTSGAALFAYAAAFSFAYLRIGAGMGALLLFGAVQATMLAWALREGERLRWNETGGLLAALGGLVALVRPGLSAPDPAGAVLMIGAGVAWGVYSLRGRAAARPLAMTASNFVRAVPMALALSLTGLAFAHLSLRGSLLAVASGALSSGVGYTLWYAALRGLTATQASVVQLSVPVLAAAGGVAVLGEALTPRLLACGMAILGGVALAVLGPRRA
jgi:drug/metabolite transporter (DMT)-like permease